MYLLLIYQYTLNILLILYFLSRPPNNFHVRDVDNRGERKKFSPARVKSAGEENLALEIPFHGSGDIVAASRADGMSGITFGVRILPADERIRLCPVGGSC